MTPHTLEGAPMEQLTVICDACRTPIADGEGYLHVDHRQIVEYRDTTRARRASLDVPGLSIAEFLATPDPARWQAHHTACYPESEHVDYDIPVAQVRTWPRLVSMTAHLMGKQWLVNTDWNALLEGATSGAGRRVTRGAMREAS